MCLLTTLMAVDSAITPTKMNCAANDDFIQTLWKVLFGKYGMESKLKSKRHTRQTKARCLFSSKPIFESQQCLYLHKTHSLVGYPWGYHTSEWVIKCLSPTKFVHVILKVYGQGDIIVISPVDNSTI